MNSTMIVIPWVNMMRGFVKSFEDSNKKLMAKFDYEGEVNQVKVVVWWCSTEPIEQVLSSDDYSLFSWSPTTKEDFAKNFTYQGKLGTEYLL